MKIRIINKIRISDFYSVFLVIAYFLAATIFFYTVVLPNLKAGIVVGADSKTYILTARYYGNLNSIKLSDLFSLKFNFFGPVVLLIFTKYNYLLIYILNSLIFLCSSFVLFKYYNFNRLLFFALMFINPITLLSLTTVNKEILGMCSIMLLLSYIKSGRIWLLLLSFVLAFFTRWQQAVFIPVLLLYLSSIRLGRNLKWQAPMIVLVIVSVIYPFVGKYIDFTGDVTRDGVQAQFNQVGGILPFLNSLQNSFLYIISFLPKALINYFGNFTRVADVFNYDIDFYNRMLVGHQVIMFLSIVWLFIKKKIRFKSVEFQIIFIYSVIYCVALTVNYRYFFPLYPLFVMLIVSKKFNLVTFKARTRTQSRRLVLRLSSLRNN